MGGRKTDYLGIMLVFSLLLIAPFAAEASRTLETQPITQTSRLIAASNETNESILQNPIRTPRIIEEQENSIEDVQIRAPKTPANNTVAIRTPSVITANTTSKITTIGIEARMNLSRTNISKINISRNNNTLIPTASPKFIYVADLPKDLQKIVLTPRKSSAQHTIVNVTTILNRTNASYTASYTYIAKENKRLLGIIPIKTETKYTLDRKGKILSSSTPWYTKISTTPKPEDKESSESKNENKISSTQSFNKAGYPALLGFDVGATLELCNLEGSCSGDVGSTHYMKDIKIAANKSLTRKIFYTVDKTNNDVNAGLLQISLESFEDNPTPTIIYARKISLGENTVDFSKVLGSKTIQQLAKEINKNMIDTALTNTSKNDSGNKYALNQKNILEKEPSINIAAGQLNKPTQFMKLYPKYYVRVIPLHDSEIVGLASNTATVEIIAPDNSSGIKLHSPKKIYTVEIKEFTPLLAPDKGICSHAMILDTDWVWMNQVIAYKGDRICPTPYKGVGEAAWYESLWNALTSGLSWISEQYAALKSGIIDVVGSVACAGDKTCKDALAVGLDIGMAAMGIPPEIPNMNELMDQGLGYLASEIAEQAGCPDAACKEVIKAGLKEAIEQTKNPNPACGDEAAAHNMGIEPVCLPDGVTAHWDPQATYRDAKLVLTIKRNYITADTAQDAALSKYRLIVRMTGYNENPVGSVITNIEPYGETLPITEPLQGDLFGQVYLDIPSLEKGESIDIPINLIATDYWVPGHKDLMHGWSTVVYKDGWPQYQYNDWWKLYYGADLNIDAKINGCGFYSQESYCIVSSDSYSTTLPMTLNP